MQQHGFDVPHGVEAICVGCDEKRREDVRYSSAKSVSEEQAGFVSIPPYPGIEWD